ncbi:hypothetical protein LSH36_733g01039 [Paralvinella palmiformis]|uniref:Cyclin-dependent kinase 2-interacting protein n=1 Tax=Paralvinella palmiformis TaxID=53620 RepID=A0AAD9J1B2_9ANNE|nr:hypothetical protein LSH36_733g01039 [Paralvinella palmiformis]
MSHKKKKIDQLSTYADHKSPTKEIKNLDSDHDESSEAEYSRVLHFSPVPVTSPEASYSGSRLTGLPRKIKDTCADWYNYVQEWHILNSKGMQVISEIANTKIAAGAELEKESGETTDLRNVLPDELENDCHKLKNVYLSMEKLVVKFEKMTSCLASVADLNQSCQDASFSNSQTTLASPTRSCTDILFKTWPSHMFADASEKLLKMYQKELSVKKSIVENVAHSSDRDTLMAYTAVWLHQPYIESDIEALVEAMVLETGLR